MDPTNRTPAGDQYSLGCVLYYALTGHVPYPEGSAVEKMMAHQLKEPTPMRELAPDGAGRAGSGRQAADGEDGGRAVQRVRRGRRGAGAVPRRSPGGVRRQPRRDGRSGQPVEQLAARSAVAVERRRASVAAVVESGRAHQSQAAVGCRSAGHADAAAVAAAFQRRPAQPRLLPGDRRRRHHQRGPHAHAAGRRAGALPKLPTRNEKPDLKPAKGARPAPSPAPAPVEEEADAPAWAEEAPESKGTVGPIALTAIAVVLMAAVYYGATVLMK